MSLDQCKISIKMCGPCSMCGVTCENEIDHFGHLFGGLTYDLQAMYTKLHKCARCFILSCVTRGTMSACEAMDSVGLDDEDPFAEILVEAGIDCHVDHKHT